MLSKYIAATKITWANGFVYRLNFVMWRVRMFIQLIAIYFLWLTITKQNQTPFGYEQSILLTYVIGSSFIRALVFSSQSINAQSEIANGDLSNYLVKPLNYFRYWLFRDFSDKFLNIIFSIAEMIIVILIFKPPIFIQTDPFYILGFIGISLLAMLLYFFFSFIVSMTTFWYAEANGWPQRFLIFTVLEFLAGGLFPLDILPQNIYNLIKYLPPTYFAFIPLQTYLGRLEAQQVVSSAVIMMGWIVGLNIFAKIIWKKGLKVYGAYGR
ncbi:ABC transporter permease [Patescibacteria group bacterium]